MREATHYLRIRLNGQGFLVPGGASAAIEQRETLAANDGSGPVTAWRSQRGRRTPAYCLDHSFRPMRPSDWQRAVFLEGTGGGVGLVVEEVQMLGRSEIPVAPFTPLGPAPTPFGHLYSGAWVQAHGVTLVLDAGVLTAYLQNLGE